MPLMVAYSGLVNKNIRMLAEMAGFDIVLEAPLSPGIIQSEIIEYLESRKMVCNSQGRIDNEISSPAGGLSPGGLSPLSDNDS